MSSRPTISPPRPDPTAARLGTDWPIAMFAGCVAALLGSYWDVAWHTERGRDSFAIPPHIMLYAGVAFAGAAVGWWALVTFLRSRSVRATLRHRPLALAILGDGVTLASAPIDYLWHDAFGRDAVLWSPPHMLGIVGLFALAAGVLLETTRDTRRLGRAFAVVAGALVLAVLLAPVQEYESDVPQFGAVWYLPVAAGGAALAFALIQAVAPRPGALTAAAAVYTVLRVVVVGFLAAVGFTPPFLPPILVPALVVDRGARAGWPVPVRALAFAVSLYAAYVPALAWAFGGLTLDAVAIAVGLPLAAALAWLAFASLTIRAPRPRALAAALALAGLVLPVAGSGHDPGQGEEVGQARLLAAQTGFGARVSVEALDPGLCPRMRPTRLVARRSGVTVTAPLQAAARCRFEGAVGLPERGRWFVYAELQVEGEGRVEAWLPVSAGPTDARFEKLAPLYRPPSARGSRVEVVAGVVLYAVNLGVFALTVVTFRRFRAAGGAS